MTTPPDERLFTAADALRDLVDLFCDREPEGELLEKITEVARGLSAKLEAAPRWDRQAALEAGLTGLDSEDGRRHSFVHRAVAGPANPSAIPIEFHFDDGVASSEVTFGAMHGGAPGRGHGGVLAGILDEFAGVVPGHVGAMAATARLTVNYRAPIPIGEPLALRAWVHERDGRKIYVRGEARRGVDLIADMEALYIAIDYSAIDTSGAARH